MDLLPTNMRGSPARAGDANVAMGMQFARLVMSYIDCDTIPFFWNYANRFALFDNISATEDTPSTPNAVAMIAGQSGETQWVKHGAAGRSVTVNGVSGTLQGPPLMNDPQPFWGSQFDATESGRAPHGSKLEYYGEWQYRGESDVCVVAVHLLWPWTLAAAVKHDRAPDADLADVRRDIAFVQRRNGEPVNWRWYEEGYDHEPTDPAGQASHEGYVSHHNGAQYFGYIANNPEFSANLRGLGDVFSDLEGGKLPARGGVFYIRGGFRNIAGLTPPIQNANFPAR